MQHKGSSGINNDKNSTTNNITIITAVILIIK